MPIVTVNGTTKYYEKHGTGKPIVFVPCLGATHVVWHPQIEILRQTHRAITFDVRGDGSLWKAKRPARHLASAGG